MASKLLPAEKKQADVLAQMNPELRKIAKELQKNRNESSQRHALSYYDMGAKVAMVLENEPTYGSNAVEQLASYLNFPGGANGLYNLKVLAISYDRGFIQQEAVQARSDGTPLELGHFLHLTKVKSAAEKKRLLREIRDKCLSVNDLARHVAALSERRSSGGRPPSVPHSPFAGLQQLFAETQKLSNRLPVLDEAALDQIAVMSASEVNPQLLTKLEQTEELVFMLEERLGSTSVKLNHALSRVKRILRQKGKAKESAEDDEPDDFAEEQAERKPKASTKKTKPKTQRAAAV